MKRLLIIALFLVGGLFQAPAFAEERLVATEKDNLSGEYVADSSKYDGGDKVSVSFFVSQTGELQGTSDSIWRPPAYSRTKDTWSKFLRLSERDWSSYGLKSLQASACNQEAYCFKTEKCSYSTFYLYTSCSTVLIQTSLDYLRFQVAVISDTGSLYYPSAGWRVPFKKITGAVAPAQQETPVPKESLVESSLLKQNELAQSVETQKLDLEFWQTIKDSDDPDMYRAYLESFPEGKFAPLAKLKIRNLGGTSVATSSIPNLDYGRYHALVIGNNDYENLPDLETAVRDARRIASVLEYDYGFDVKLLKDATRDQIIKSLSGLRKQVRSEDNLLIYYAGHGNLDKKANEGYWLPTDAEREDPSNWIPNDTIVSQVRAMDAKHVMVVADSCFSGTITRGLKIEQRTPDWLQKIVRKKARTALTSGGLEPVMDSGGGGNHSAFASAFISLLEENDGVLDASQLFSQLRPKVMVNSPQTPEYGNIHQAGHDGGDFLFVRR